MSLAEKLRPTTTISPPHVVIEARAGTGKTTTLIEGLNLLKGKTVKITPSSQQQAVWDTLLLSQEARTICFVAFNKSIATELQTRVPPGVEAMTMHSLGFKAVQRAFPGGLKVDSFRVQNIISSLLGEDIRVLRRNMLLTIIAIEKLVSLVKANLSETDHDSLARLAAHYDIELNGSRKAVFDLVPRVIERCRDVAADKSVDFDDMVWLPVALDLQVAQFDLLLVDESQDLHRGQQALARKSGRRLILCGDPRQAIYGFAGADSESMARMATELEATEQGCVTLPLTVTRRCGKAIVAEANKIVQEFSAHESNGPGLVSQGLYRKDKESDVTYDLRVQSGDFIICRCTAPLVSQCFRFIRQGKKAQIQGRDVGKGLITLLKKMKTESVSELTSRLSDWLHKETELENAKRIPSESRLIVLQDKYDCLMCFTSNAKSVDEIVAAIESIFTDDKESTGIRLSSIHKAKGLEADRVFFLTPKEAPCPHPMAKTAWQMEQEMNLRYVGITRARKELVWVT